MKNLSLLHLLIKREMQEINQHIRTTRKIKSQFLAEVVFGRPSKDCVNFGICRIESLGAPSKNCNCKSQCSQGIVSIFNPTHIEIDFLKSTVNATTYQQFFANKRFIVEEKFLYQKENCSFYIGVGNYPIIENDSLIKVIFSSTRIK